MKGMWDSHEVTESEFLLSSGWSCHPIKPILPQVRCRTQGRLPRPSSRASSGDSATTVRQLMPSQDLPRKFVGQWGEPS